MDLIRDASVKKRKRRRQAILGTAGTVVALALFLAVYRLPKAAPSVDFATLWPDTVKRGPMLRQVRGYGSLVPIPEDVRLIPAETDVRVERILILPGTPVAPESVIMELTNPQVEQEAVTADQDLKSAFAQFESTKAKVDSDLLALKAEAATVAADYENAHRQATTNRELEKIGVLSDSALRFSLAKERELATRNQIEEERITETTKAVDTQLEVQRANIEQKRAMVQLRGKQLDALRVRAGIAGVLQALDVQVGQRAVQGTILAKVVQPEHLKAELKIPETQAKDIVPGQLAEIDTHNGVVKGAVSRVDPAVQNGTVTVDVKLSEAPPKGSRPDLSVDGTVTLERLDNVLYIGRPAFGEEKSTVGIFRIDHDGKTATRVPVELGRRSVNFIEVVRGLKEGDQVILSDMSRLDNNVDKIRLER